jgi:hypothetical protein
VWRDIAGGTAADPGFVWALVMGVLLIGIGLLGFVPNPVVGAPSAAWGTPLLLTGDAHDVLHLVGGAVALHAALGMSRAHRDPVLIGLGAAALILLALGLLDGRWFGIAPFHVGLADQLLHLVVGVGSLVMGLAGTGAITVPVVTGAYQRSELGLAGGAAVAGAADPMVTQVVAQSGPGAVAVTAPAPEPIEALPEPLGLDLHEPEPAPGSTTDAEADAALVGEPGVAVAEPAPPADPEPAADTSTDPHPAPHGTPAPEPDTR